MTENKELTQLGKNIRKDFPFYKNNPNISYLDSAATSLVPRDVINKIIYYYESLGVSVHRGVYQLAAKTSEIYEDARKKIKHFLSAGSEYEIIFTRNTTEAINLIAYSFEKAKDELNELFSGWKGGLKTGDIVLISESEHHSNIIPWQIISERTGIKIKYIPIVKETGALDITAFNKIKNDLDDKDVKIISLAQVSNVTGIVYDLKPFISYAREKGSVFIVDGAQSVCHQKINLSDLSPDFFVFSAHKMLGPKGIGALCGKKEILNKMPVFLGGGDMILSVNKEKSTYNEIPYKFEAGTPNISAVFGFSAAIDYLEKIGLQNISDWEKKLTLYAMEKLSEINIQFFGPSLEQVKSNEFKKVGVVSFGINGIHPHDIGTLLDENNVCIRVGHHCCQLLMKAWDVPATCRASFYLYNDFEDVDNLINGLRKTIEFFGTHNS
ncbi:MAG: SufS family cysteine desulfurase [Spirochaetia bacterium]|nr:SufS family cysteine desulfurase [Spirochaetia bacterium]